ncbi:MAG: isochorismate synthase [Actinobacteria bacterium]|nr:isochorismate synthase [Actinomycetota bacterium]
MDRLVTSSFATESELLDAASSHGRTTMARDPSSNRSKSTAHRTTLGPDPSSSARFPSIGARKANSSSPNSGSSRPTMAPSGLRTSKDRYPTLTSLPPLASTNSFQVRPGIEVERYLSAVGAIRDAVRSGEITKAVIARDVIVEASDPIDVHGLLLRLKASFGSSYRYSFDGFIGASPELLVEIRGSEIFSHPLAGTTPRTGDPVTDERLASELLASPKNQIEHRVVIDMVHDTLLPHCSFLDWEPEPTVVKVANVQHLGTRLQGALSTPRLHVLDAARMLSPTPALGGFPRDAALELIERHEGLDRGRYGGAVGWFDSRGDGAFAVAIRCADLSADRRTARLFAGGGIVAESEPLSELAETQAKFQAMLAAIIRP